MRWVNYSMIIYRMRTISKCMISNCMKHSMMTINRQYSMINYCMRTISKCLIIYRMINHAMRSR